MDSLRQGNDRREVQRDIVKALAFPREPEQRDEPWDTHTSQKTLRSSSETVSPSG
ncbi:hypothetical protein FA13DRAFT_1741666 [Coprinellus micaceus]|uniref:Uncharacterized protein n=1 Tax=Coprinellus micaceus TaxID=71717 RepID=A0A4Y7SIR8_COPMI|nr:hypothetical protein FA13DRAFT_1741666 [Coprinellus micaceus]